MEYIYLGDNKKRTVGHKRNNLMDIAQGRFITFVDDDDRITEDYVKTLINAIDYNPNADVIVFKVMCSVNGAPAKPVYYDASFAGDRDFPQYYQRIPNHLMCIRREHAVKVRFDHKNFAEDRDFAKKLKPMFSGGSQSVIDKVLYYYDFSNQTSTTQ